MKRTKLLIATILIILQFNMAYAKPDEPEPILPKWASARCVETIMRIVSHEVGNMDEESMRFVAEQVIYDIERMGCNNLTAWRWKIGPYPVSRASGKVRLAVWESVVNYPNMDHGMCKFIGYLGDVAVWRSYGYRVSIDYRHSVGKLTVIGVNCK